MSYTGNNVRVVNPFDHPRSFVADFLIAEKLIQHGVFEIHKARSFLRPSPRIVMHQLEKTEGGLKSVEDRVLRELAVAAGAREVLIHIGDKVPVVVSVIQNEILSQLITNVRRTIVRIYNLFVF